MVKGLCIGGLVIASVLLLFFALDLFSAIPFGKANTMMDIAMIVVAVILGYLSWSSLREIKV